MKLEFVLLLVGLYGLTEQLKVMERLGEPPLSTYDIWTNEVGNFMLDNGLISELTDPTTYITDTYMKMVSEDPKLRAWALGQDPSETETASGTSARLQGGLLAPAATGLLFLIGFH